MKIYKVLEGRPQSILYELMDQLVLMKQKVWKQVRGGFNTMKNAYKKY